MTPHREQTPQVITVTQRTVERVFGMPARTFLETLRAHPEIPRTAVGKLRYVRVEELQAFLDQAQPATRTQVSTLTDVSAILAAVGLELNGTE